MGPVERTDWDAALAEVGRTLSLKGVPVADLEARCEGPVLRALREADVYPSSVISLVSDEPVEGTACRVWGYVLGAAGQTAARAGAGFVAIVWGSGAVTYARVLKYKSAADGGNDYAVLDRVKPAVPF